MGGSNPRMPEPQSGVNHFTTPAIFLYTGSRLNPITKVFGDLSSYLLNYARKGWKGGYSPQAKKGDLQSRRVLTLFATLRKY